MDPLTHALFGSATARTALARPLGASAWLPGIAGALLPDLDALVRSDADPLLYAEFHRHFTHALAFVPIGGAVAALPWLISPRTRPRWRAYLAAATAGYATHGALDASTTYGTLLLWPFSDTRVAWNAISIIDPLFTLVLLASVAVALWRGTAFPALIGTLVCVAYLLAGTVQRDRALDAQTRVAGARGHEVSRGAVFPSAGSTLVWRSLYEAGDTLFMDHIRVSPSGTSTWRPGYQMRPARAQALPPEVRADERLRRDFERFRWFAAGWVAAVPGELNLVGDARYSGSTERYEPIWAVRLMPGGQETSVVWVDRSRQRRLDLSAMWATLRGTDPAYIPVPGAAPRMLD